MQVDKVGDDLAGDPVVGEHFAQNAGGAVVEGDHAVKRVGG